MGDEERVVDAFAAYLEALGWTVHREVAFCDLVARRDREIRSVEAKGRTSARGLDVDTLYGQLLRRMPETNDPTARWIVGVPTEMIPHALRVPSRIRQTLRIDVYEVDADGRISGPR